MFINNLSIYSVSFIGIILIIMIISLSNARNIFVKRKKRRSTYNNDLYNVKYMSNFTKISFEDDEDLIQSDIILNFCDKNSIELRLEQDLDSDNDDNV